MSKKTRTLFLIFVLLLIFPSIPSMGLGQGGESEKGVVPTIPAGDDLSYSINMTHQVQNKIFHSATLAHITPSDSVIWHSEEYPSMLENDGWNWWFKASHSDTGTFKMWITFSIQSPYVSLSTVHYDWRFTCVNGDVESYTNYLEFHRKDGSGQITGSGEDVWKTGSTALSSNYIIDGYIHGEFFLLVTDSQAVMDDIELEVDQLTFEYNPVNEIRRSTYSAQGGTMRYAVDWTTWDYMVNTTLSVPDAWTFQDVNPDCSQTNDEFECLVPEDYEAVYIADVLATANWNNVWGDSFESSGNEYVTVMDGAASYNLTSTSKNFTESWTNEAWIVWSSYGSATLEYASGSSVSAGTAGKWTTTLTYAASISYLNFSGTNAIIDGIAVYNSSVTTGETITGTARNIHTNGYTTANFYDFSYQVEWAGGSIAGSSGNATTDSSGAWSVTPTFNSTRSVPNFIYTGGGVGTDYAEIPISSELQVTSAITVEAWIYPDPPHKGGQGGIINHISGYSNSRLFVADDGGLLGQVFIGGSTNGNFLSVGTPITNNAWNHYAYRYNGSYEAFFVDGVENNARARSGDVSTGSNNPLLAWGYTIHQWYHYNGSIRDFRIYNTALSKSDIQHNINYPEDPVTTGLVCWLAMDEGTGTDAYDAESTNDATLVLTSGTWATTPAYTTGSKRYTFKTWNNDDANDYTNDTLNLYQLALTSVTFDKMNDYESYFIVTGETYSQQLYTVTLDGDTIATDISPYTVVTRNSTLGTHTYSVTATSRESGDSHLDSTAKTSQYTVDAEFRVVASFTYTTISGECVVEATYDCSYYAYENDSQVQTGLVTAHGYSFRWTLKTTLGQYVRVGVKFTYGAEIRWANSSYETEALAIGLDVTVWDFEVDEYGGDYVELTIGTNWANCTITVYDYFGTNRTKYSGAEGTITYAIGTETGVHIVYVLINGTASYEWRIRYYDWKGEYVKPGGGSEDPPPPWWQTPGGTTLILAIIIIAVGVIGGLLTKRRQKSYIIATGGQLPMSKKEKAEDEDDALTKAQKRYKRDLEEAENKMRDKPTKGKRNK